MNKGAQVCPTCKTPVSYDEVILDKNFWNAYRAVDEYDPKTLD